jgi:hypothetical protein
MSLILGGQYHETVISNRTGHSILDTLSNLVWIASLLTLNSLLTLIVLAEFAGFDPNPWMH